MCPHIFLENVSYQTGKHRHHANTCIAVYCWDGWEDISRLFCFMFQLAAKQRVYLDLQHALQITSILKKVPLSCGGLPLLMWRWGFHYRDAVPKGLWGRGGSPLSSLLGACINSAREGALCPWPCCQDQSTGLEQ